MFYLRYQDDRVQRDWYESTYDELVHVRRGVCKVNTRASADELRTHAGFHLIDEAEYKTVLSGRSIETGGTAVAVADAGGNGTDEFSWGTDNVPPTRRGRPKGTRDKAHRVRRTQ